MQSKSRLLNHLLLGVAIAAVSTPTFSQTAAEDAAQASNDAAGPADEDAIIVTATKRSTRVQDVPFSINAQTQEDLERAHAQSIEDISRVLITPRVLLRQVSMS